MSLKLGVIENSTFVKYEKESAKLRMGGGSWTLNLTRLRKLGWTLNRASNESKIKKFKYITEKANYEISAFDAVMGGFVKNFRGEEKLVVPIKHWRVSGE